MNRDLIAPINFTEEIVPEGDRRRLSLEPDTHFYRSNTGCVLFVSHAAKFGWHLSISHPRRHPTWEEIREARYQFIPDDVWMAMDLPPKEFYINIHPNCFHLWQHAYPRGYDHLALQHGLNPDNVFFPQQR